MACSRTAAMVTATNTYHQANAVLLSGSFRWSDGLFCIVVMFILIC
jgi:hypothetical protein